MIPNKVSEESSIFSSNSRGPSGLILPGGDQISFDFQVTGDTAAEGRTPDRNLYKNRRPLPKYLNCTVLNCSRRQYI
jgi:hypothetical protein